MTRCREQFYFLLQYLIQTRCKFLTKKNLDQFTDTWGSGSVWPSANAASGSGNLWTPLDGATERGTPSSLNSFLPESLLGSELN